MPFNNIVARGDVIERQDTIDVVMDGLENTSAARTLFRPVTIGKSSARFPVLAALPLAYWVNGDTGLKQTTEMGWKNKFLNVEELAVIVPVPQNVLDDSDFDIWAEARPKVGEAIDRALDAAIWFGDGAPASFPTSVTAGATAAGNVVAAGSNAAAAGGWFGDLDDALGKVEDDGFVPSGWVASRTVRSRFRKARKADGSRVDADRVNGQFSELDGLPIVYTMDGMWATGLSKPLAFVGDWKNQFVLGIRKDVTYEVFREGVIQDNTGAIVYNLMQQDMVALRVTFRAAWEVANTMNYANVTEAQRYPAAVITTAAA